jgi:hypothetical protein
MALATSSNMQRKVEGFEGKTATIAQLSGPHTPNLCGTQGLHPIGGYPSIIKVGVVSEPWSRGSGARRPGADSVTLLNMSIEGKNCPPSMSICYLAL